VGEGRRYTLGSTPVGRGSSAAGVYSNQSFWREGAPWLAFGNFHSFHELGVAFPSAVEMAIRGAAIGGLSLSPLPLFSSPL